MPDTNDTAALADRLEALEARVQELEARLMENDRQQRLETAAHRVSRKIIEHHRKMREAGRPTTSTAEMFKGGF